jgi:hypothetical protein
VSNSQNREKPKAEDKVRNFSVRFDGYRSGLNKCMLVMVVLPVAFVPVPIALVVVVPIFIIPVVVAAILVSVNWYRSCDDRSQSQEG